jgi:acetoin:2,6-dichlorophenolindophenol oxidoreductase subunit alpha
MELRIPSDRALELYTMMQRIRRFEESVSELYARGKIPGFLHTYVGEEAVATGVCANLTVDDWITSTHRGHGHLLAKGGRTDRSMAELFGRATGYNRGKGGSMHIAEPELGHLGANAIVGAGISLINGAALSAQYRGTSQVGVSFFGDGASNTGSFHEALNFAAVHKLPSVFVCENNNYAESTPRWYHQRVGRISERAAAYCMPGDTVDGNDVIVVYLAAGKAVARARRGEGPTLLECVTFRRRGHHEADNQFYRPKDELANPERHCPILKLRGELLATGTAESTLDAIHAAIEEEIRLAVAFAESSPHPEPATARADIYSGREE